MAITKEKKQELVDLYTELLQQSHGIIITEYRGMNMSQLSDLRMKLAESDGKYMVTKNTLLKLALERCDMAVPEDLLTGPVAVGFALGDIAGTAKVLLDAGKDDALPLSVKGGIIGAAAFGLTQVEQLTKLPSLPELRAQLAGLVATPATHIVSILVQPARDVVGVLQAASSQIINVLAAYVAKNEAEEAA
ncbi:MAG: 50S ribosomal protein L10 [Anaerolineae bacterium]|nr:50S ribosomal protein L10 [Anaerolineae bacterium]